MMLLLMYGIHNICIDRQDNMDTQKLKKRPVHIGIFVGIDNENRARAYKRD